MKFHLEQPAKSFFFSLPILCFGFSTQIHAVDLLRWDITGVTGVAGSSDASPAVLGVAGTAFIGGGAGGNSGSPSGTWNRQFSNLTTTFDDAQVAGNFFSFSTSAEPGFEVTIDGISQIEFRRTSTIGDTAQLGLFFSTDDGATYSQTGTTFTPERAVTSAAVEFSSELATTPLVIAGGDTVLWRIVLTNQEPGRLGIVNSGTENIVFSGTSTADVASSNLLFTGTGGSDWNTSPTNTNWADIDNGNSASAFATNDNVTFDMTTNAVVDSGGVSPGAMVVNAFSGTVAISGGPITGLSLEKSGNSTLRIDDENLFLGGVTIERGIVTPVTDLSLGDSGITIDGGTLNTGDAPFEMTNVFSVGTAGATINTNDDATFSGAFVAINAGIEESNQLVKTGAAILTLSETGSTAFGAQSNVGAPGTSLEFDILEGGVIFDGGGSRYLGNTCTWDAPVTLNGGVIMLHGSTIDGTGVIEVTANSLLRTRFNRGSSFVENAITLNGQLVTDTQTGVSDLTLSGVVGGPGNFFKAGNGFVSLTGDNTYAGTTFVTQGVLLIEGDSSLATGPTTVATGATLGGNGQSGAPLSMEPDSSLTMSISDWTGPAGTGYSDLLVESLTINNPPTTVVVETAGLVNFAETGATFTFLNTTNGITGFDPSQVTLDINDFLGEGSFAISQVSNSLVLTYTAAGADDFATWASGFPITGGPTDDDDLDGVDNQTEYAFGLDPSTGSSVNPYTSVLDASTNAFTYTRRDTSLSGLSYTYEYSLTLDDDWTLFTPSSEVGDSSSPVEMVTVIVPTPAELGIGPDFDGKLFFRVLAQ